MGKSGEKRERNKQNKHRITKKKKIRKEKMLTCNYVRPEKL